MFSSFGSDSCVRVLTNFDNLILAFLMIRVLGVTIFMFGFYVLGVRFYLRLVFHCRIIYDRILYDQIFTDLFGPMRFQLYEFRF